MRILLTSYRFLPEIGGIETSSLAFARAWTAMGHEVTILTETAAEADYDSGFDFHVLRRPNRTELLEVYRWAEVVHQNNISLTLLWPTVLRRKPLIITHQGWLMDERSPGWRQRLKALACRRATNVAISSVIAESLPRCDALIPNPYRDGLFRDSQGERDFDIAFLGRLVSDKGCDLLLDAVAQLKADSGPAAKLLVIGDGPDRTALEAQAEKLGLADQVHFEGALEGEALVQALNRSKVMAVPSRFREPMGIVALEGLACGCRMVVADDGGLPEVTGPYGEAFKRGDADDLARVLSQTLQKGPPSSRECKAIAEHLAGFSEAAIGQRYLELFAQLRA